MTHRLVRGACPACGLEKLALTPNGVLVCCADGCDRPTAAAELLADRETEHVAQIGPDDFTLRHPLRERLDSVLFDCRIHAEISASDGPPVTPGRYRVLTTAQGLVYQPLHRTEQ